MNKIYNLIWNAAKGTWSVVGEKVKACGKRASGTVSSCAAVSLVVLSSQAWAAPPVTELPTGGNVVAGQASINQSGSTMTINQTTNRAAVNWNTFNVGSDATVNFNQPSSNSVTLNRVQSGNASQIFGQINANGQVFLTNPSGAYFAPGASVNVGGLVATTHSISNDDFMAGNYTFSRNGAEGSIINEGDLTAELGGYIALLAPEVRNHGVIVADLGTVALAAGESYTLNIDTNGTLTSLQVEPATIDALVENRHAVKAAGGLVIFSSQSINTLQGGVINNTGTIEATGISHDGGRIILEASNSISHSGTINADAAANSSGDGGSVILIADLTNPDSETYVDGSISVRAGDLGGDGGFIETSASKIDISATTKIDATSPSGKSGEWLIDPVDITIDATLATAIQAALGSTNVQITTAGSNTPDTSSGESGTNGDITVNSDITWNTANALFLDADHNIYINADITATNAEGKVVLLYGQGAVAAGNTATYDFGLTSSGFAGSINLQAGQNFTTQLGLDGIPILWTVITNRTGLEAITSNLAGNYVLGTNFDLTTTNWNDTGVFTGNFDGLGHVLDRLTTSGTSNIGLFESLQGASVSNLGLTNVNLDGVNGSQTGSIAGSSESGTTINNVFAQGNIDSFGYVGGLVAYIQGDTTISNSYFNGNINSLITTSSNNTGAGGLVGYVGGDNNHILNSSASGNIYGYNQTAGLVGVFVPSGTTATNSIENSWASSVIEAKHDYVGGLVGLLGRGQIIDSYATGVVNVTSSGNAMAGGLVGRMQSGTDGSITGSYATVDVTSTHGAGGLVGQHNSTGTISRSYATGNITGGIFSTGGLVADHASGIIRDSYFTGTVESTGSRAGGLVGYQGNTASIINSYSIATSVLGSTTSSGLVGRQDGAVTNSYFDNTILTGMTDDVTYGQSTTWLKTQSNLNSNWNFTTVWEMSGGYPCLSGVSASCTTAVSFTLSDINNGYIYSGSEFSLDSLWDSPTTIFGGLYNDWTYGIGNDYVFSYGGNIITGFTDAGTYSNISVDVIKAGYDEQSTGSNVGSFVIAPKALTMSGLTSADKVYDGTTTAIVNGTAALQAFETVGTGTTLDGKAYTGDTVSLTGTAAGTFNDSNVATATTVSFSGLSLTGAQAGNYILSEHATASHSITAKALTIAGLVADNKVYDGTDTATISNWGTVATGVGTETVVLNNGTAATFINENVGTSKLVVATGYTLGDGGNGGLASNYSVNAAAAQADITKKDITADTITANNKVYDGTNAATLSVLTSSGFIGGDDISLASGSNTFDDENVGTGKTVTVSTIALAGSDASNYNLTSATETTTANITEKPLENSTETTPPPPPHSYAVTSEAQSSPETGVALGGSSSGVSVSLESMPGLGDNGIISVTIPKGSSTSGAGFSFTLPEQLAESVSKNGGDVQVSLPSGETLPSWLTFNEKSLTFTSGAVPDGAFPLQVMVVIGNEQFAVIISERVED